jgi:DNA-binding NarL/FixJ family response regulator
LNADGAAPPLREFSFHHRRPTPRSRREREVLTLLAEGLDQQEIATRLVITRRTVCTHIERVLSKLGVHSRAQAVGAAYRLRLLEPASA